MKVDLNKIHLTLYIGLRLTSFTLFEKFLKTNKEFIREISELRIRGHLLVLCTHISTYLLCAEKEQETKAVP
jgi:hypothetical protein